MSSLVSLCELLRRFGTPKELANAGGFSPWTATRYQKGVTVPDALTLIRLMAASREFAAAIMRLAGLDELSLDIEQARLMRALADLEQRRIDAHAAMERACAPDRPVAGTLGPAKNGAGVATGASPRRGGRTAKGAAGPADPLDRGFL